MVAHACNPNYLKGRNRRIAIQGQQGQKLWDPLWKVTKGKRIDGLAQMVKYLLNKSESLSSNPSTAKKKKKE
jgi:hypothetical protein